MRMTNSQPEDLWSEIQAYSFRLTWRANGINTRQRRDARRWKSLGSRQALQNCARNLAQFCQQYPNAYTLHIALQDYVQVVEKVWQDSCEESKPWNTSFIQQWRATGEAQVLAGVYQTLTGYLQRYQVGTDHVLSADGQGMVALHTPPFQPLGPFPILPDDLPEPRQFYEQLITGVEDALSEKSRILVKMEMGLQNCDLMLMIADRLLQYTPIRRILVLTEASLLSMMRARFAKAISLEDGQCLSILHPSQQGLSTPLHEDTRICFAPLREAQLHFVPPMEGEGERNAFTRVPASTFDAVVLYNVEHSCLPLTQTLAALNAVPYLFGFTTTSNGMLRAFFRENVIVAHASPTQIPALVRSSQGDEA